MVLLAFLMFGGRKSYTATPVLLYRLAKIFFFLLQRLKRHVHIVRYRGERKGWIKENLWVEMMIHLHLSPVYQPQIKPSH
jgi:hypothetical protein